MKTLLKQIFSDVSQSDRMAINDETYKKERENSIMLESSLKDTLNENECELLSRLIDSITFSDFMETEKAFIEGCRFTAKLFFELSGG